MAFILECQWVPLILTEAKLPPIIVEIRAASTQLLQRLDLAIGTYNHLLMNINGSLQVTKHAKKIQIVPMAINAESALIQAMLICLEKHAENFWVTGRPMKFAESFLLMVLHSIATSDYQILKEA